MGCRLSVIIPNRNGEETIGLCLEALFSSSHDSFEVVVVDDCSSDNSTVVIEQFPCRLIRLEQHVGAAVARNIGAENASGERLFFTDADCLVGEDTLLKAERLAKAWGPGVVIGGTYKPLPYDRNFFSIFQSLFIHYFELKDQLHPDYIATHAMVIDTDVFARSGGFPAEFLPLIEDVEFSHRLRDKGYRLVMETEVQIQHVFGYQTLIDSLKNGYVKSRYWTIYSMENRDILADSGTASFELKINALVLLAVLALALLYAILPGGMLFFIITGLILCNLLLQQGIFSFFHKTAGWRFCAAASLYYLFLYPFAVAVGAAAGMVQFLAGLTCIFYKRPAAKQ